MRCKVSRSQHRRRHRHLTRGRSEPAAKANVRYRRTEYLGKHAHAQWLGNEGVSTRQVPQYLEPLQAHVRFKVAAGAATVVHRSRLNFTESILTRPTGHWGAEGGTCTHITSSWLQLAEIGFHSIPTALALPRANSLWAGTPRDIKTLHSTHSPSRPPSGPPQQILRLFQPLVQIGSPVRQAQLQLSRHVHDTYRRHRNLLHNNQGQQLTIRLSCLATQGNLVY